MTRQPRSWLRRMARWSGIALVFLASSALGSMTYFHFAPPASSCLTCHEMQTVHDQWAASAHKNVHCRECHGGSLTLNWHALQEHLGRVVGHFSSTPRQDFQLSHDQVLRIHESCKACHESEFARWKQSGHGADYAAIFLDPKQNQAEQLNADCLRCHGMFFPQAIDQLVSPLDTTGPWKLHHPEMAHQPVIPCLSCHQVHRPPPASQDAAGDSTAARAKAAPSWAASFYSRHEKTHLDLPVLPVPAINRDGKPLRVASDPRQRNCAQCHAPNARHALGSQDDKTPAGVHEGLSCLACHESHSNQARNSCAQCHPGISNCHLDVLTMDTTFQDAKSKHDIHTVSCGDCHQGKRPEPANKK